MQFTEEEQPKKKLISVLQQYNNIHILSHSKEEEKNSE